MRALVDLLDLEERLSMTRARLRRLEAASKRRTAEDRQEGLALASAVAVVAASGGGGGGGGGGTSGKGGSGTPTPTVP